MIPRVNAIRCSGCGRCVAACKPGLLTLDVSGSRKHAALASPERCTRCGNCIKACPLGAIAMSTRRQNVQK